MCVFLLFVFQGEEIRRKSVAGAWDAESPVLAMGNRVPSQMPLVLSGGAGVGAREQRAGGVAEPHNL